MSVPTGTHSRPTSSLQAVTRQARGALVLAAATVAVVAAFVGTTDPRPGDRRYDGRASDAPGLTQSVSTAEPAFQARAEPRRLTPLRQARTSPHGVVVLSAVVVAMAGVGRGRRFRYRTGPPLVPLRLFAEAPHRGPPLFLG